METILNIEPIPAYVAGHLMHFEGEVPKSHFSEGGRVKRYNTPIVVKTNGGFAGHPHEAELSNRTCLAIGGAYNPNVGTFALLQGEEGITFALRTDRLVKESSAKIKV